MRPQAKGCARPPGVGRGEEGLSPGLRRASPRPASVPELERIHICRLSHSLRSFCLGAHRRLTRHGLWPGRGASGERAARGDQRVFRGRGQGGRGTIRDGPTEGGDGVSGGPTLGEGDMREHGRGQQFCWGSRGHKGGPGGQVTLAARLGEELDCGWQRLVMDTPGEQVQRPASGRSDTDTRRELAQTQ